MKINYHTNVKPDDLIVEIAVRRSVQKWNEGLRSQRRSMNGSQLAVYDRIKESVGLNRYTECLLSSYHGASITVLTTAAEMWVWLTANFPDSEPIAKNHFISR
jgi:hypothetical protein